MEINKIYNIDCFIGMKSIVDGSVDLIVTDPPYELATGGGGGTVNKVLKLKDSLQDLERADIHRGYDIKAFAKEVFRLQGGNINAYFWCNKTQIPEYFDVYVKGLKCKFDILTWIKSNALPTYSNKYLTDCEYCLYFHSGGGRKCHPSTYEDAKTYFFGEINAKDKKMYHHPTIKPLNFIQKLIRNSSEEGDVVLDPFIGSGTTAVAAIKQNRDYIGFEINEAYYKTACKRIQDTKSQLTLF